MLFMCIWLVTTGEVWRDSGRVYKRKYMPHFSSETDLTRCYKCYKCYTDVTLDQLQNLMLEQKQNLPRLSIVETTSRGCGFSCTTKARLRKTGSLHYHEVKRWASYMLCSLSWWKYAGLCLESTYISCGGIVARAWLTIPGKSARARVRERIYTYGVRTWSQFYICNIWIPIW